MKKVIRGLILECVQGNIVQQKDIVAIVNAANAQLAPGGGVAGAIYHAAGPGLAQESLPLGPIKPGEAVITGAHNLPNKYVIHCLGPRYGKDNPADVLLRNCYQNALTIAENYKIESIAFPAISTGVFGYPIHEAAGVAFKTIIDTIPKVQSLRLIRFVLYNNDYLLIHEKILTKLTGSL